MGLKRSFKTDNILEVKGIIIEHDDVRIRVARAGGANKAFTKALANATRPHQRAVKVGAMSEKKSNEILMKVYANTIVLAWEKNTGTETEPVWSSGIDPEDTGAKPGGDLLPVTEENIIKVFTELPELFIDLVSQTQNSSLFLAELSEDLAKN